MAVCAWSSDAILPDQCRSASSATDWHSKSQYFWRFQMHVYDSDLGHGAMDDSSETIPNEPPSLKTTKWLAAEADSHDFVLHVGDIAYAEGYSTTVRL